MSQLPLRSLRLIGKPDTYYERFVGSAGEIYYDNTNQTLRVYQGNALEGKILADRSWVQNELDSLTLIQYDAEVSNRVEVNSDQVRVRFNTQLDGQDQTTWIFDPYGVLTLPQNATIGPDGPASVILEGGNGVSLRSIIDGPAPDTMDYSYITTRGSNHGTEGVEIWARTYQGNHNIWSFGKDGTLTFPDGTIQSTAFAGGPISELNDETNGNKLLIDQNGMLILTDSNGTLDNFSGGGAMGFGIKWDAYSFQGGIDPEINYGEGILFLDAGREGITDYGTGIGLRTYATSDNNSANTWYFTLDGKIQKNYSNDLVLSVYDGTNPVKDWALTGDGLLRFPDGTEQSTAYVSTPSTPLFVVANYDGYTAWSNNGESWTVGDQLTFNGATVGGGPSGLERIAVADTYIVYTAYDVDSDLDNQLWYATNYNTNPTIVDFGLTGSSHYQWFDIEHGGNYTVAVGEFYESDGVGGVLDPVPAFAYTQNGSSWTVGDIDPNYIDYVGAPAAFNSVWYGNEGWLFVALTDGNPAGAGAFYVSDITAGLYEADWISFSSIGSPNFDSVVFTGDRWWLRYTFARNLYAVSDSANPLTASWTEVDIYTGSVLNGFGETTFWEDTGGTIGSTSWFVGATGDGQVIASSDGGETWVASVPLAYTGTIASATETFPCVVTFSGNSPANDGEKIVVSNATPSAYNGTYFVKYDQIADDGSYELYEDPGLSSGIDARSYGTFVSGDVEFTHGQYIDSIGFGLEKFIAGNDNEQLFVSTNLTSWTKVNDQNDNFNYWNDISFNANWGAGLSAVSRLTNSGYSLTLSSSGATSVPGALIVATDYPADGALGNATALSLNKQVQILDTGNDGQYSLANGVEGQIMYFVPAVNTAFHNIFVAIENAKTTTGIDSIPEVNSIVWQPFIEPALYADGSATTRSNTTTIAMAIFADGGWNLQGGWWD